MISSLSLSHIKLRSSIVLMRLNKPIGILLLLWPTLMALWIAGEGSPNLKVVLIFIMGTIVMRSAGCVINDLADRKFDKEVARTCTRPLVSGVHGGINPFEAKMLFITLLMMGLFLVLQLNINTIALSVIALLLATTYPWMKRFTHFPQGILGLAFGWGIPMAYTALDVSLGLDTWILFLANFCWIIAYDTEYAMADKEDDIKIGVKSAAILFGKYDCWMIGIFQTTALALFAYLGILLDLGLYYYAGIALGFCFFLYHQYLIQNREPKNCFKAFLHNQYVGMVLFLGLWLGYFFDKQL